jgi:hypothetical protein
MNEIEEENVLGGSFVVADLDPEALKYWGNIKDNFTENKIKIINLIETWRKENSVSIREFCKRIDMTPRQYYKIINQEKNITLLSLAEIAVFAGFKMDINFKKLN